MSWQRAGDAIVEFMAEVLDDYHDELSKAGVKIDLLVKLPKLDKHGEPVPGGGLRHHGYAAAAVTRIVGLKDRVKGNGDAEIVIDQQHWDRFAEEQRRALLDHELTHLELVLDDDGNLQTDDAGRPKLRVRRHDWQFGWFDQVVRRHGKNALEARQAVEWATGDSGQLYLPGLIPPGAEVRHIEIASGRRRRSDNSQAVDKSL